MSIRMEVEITCKATLDELWVIEVSEETAREIEARPSYAADLIGGTDEAKHISEEDLRVYDEEDREVTAVRRQS